jgi:Arc/MetJ family transcription regulator
MRVTIHIEDSLLADLMRLTRATTKAQAVRDALKELIRLRRKEELLALRGRLDIEDNWRQLRESEETTLSAQEQAELWRQWAERGPQGPISIEDAELP